METSNTKMIAISPEGSEESEEARDAIGRRSAFQNAEVIMTRLNDENYFCERRIFL
jgi:hypothetical protein